MICSASQCYGSPQVVRRASARIRRRRTSRAAIVQSRVGRGNGKVRRTSRLSLAHHPAGLIFADDPLLQYEGLGSWLKKAKKKLSIKSVKKAVKKIAPAAALLTPFAPAAVGMLVAKSGVAAKLLSKGKAIQKTAKALKSSPAGSSLIARLMPKLPAKSVAAQLIAPRQLSPGTATPGEEIEVDGAPATVAATPDGQLVAMPNGLPGWAIPAAIGVGLLVLSRRGR